VEVANFRQPSRPPGWSPKIFVAASFQLALQRPRANRDACRYKNTEFNGGFEEDGNPAKGRSLFVKKGCQSCHGESDRPARSPVEALVKVPH